MGEFVGISEPHSAIEATPGVSAALARAGIIGLKRNELVVSGTLTPDMIDAEAKACQRTDGGIHTGRLVFRLERLIGARAMDAAVRDTHETRPKYYHARDANEARAVHVQGTIRQRVEAIDPAERDRCRDAVFEESPWLRRIVGDKPVVESKIMRSLVLTHWQKHGRTRL